MALILVPNITFDIYRGSAPPSDPTEAGVSGYLMPDWRGGQEHGDRQHNSLCWTHILLVDATVEIRDGYVGQGGYSTQDHIYIPDQNGTLFNVVFIERVNRGTPNEHKRIYVDRQTPNWPTNNL